MKDQYPDNWLHIAREVKSRADWQCELCGLDHGPVPQVLTVHHIDYDPKNSSLKNLIALCQRCHLKVQGWLVQPVDREDLLRRRSGFGYQMELGG